MASLLRWYEHGVDKILGVNDNNDEIDKGGRKYKATSLNKLVKTKNQTINAYKGLTLQKLLHPGFLHQDINFDLQDANDFIKEANEYINRKANYNTFEHRNKLTQLRHLLYEIKKFVENKENPNYVLEMSTLKKHITPEFWNDSDLLNKINMMIGSIRTRSSSSFNLSKIQMETRGGRSSRKQKKTRKSRR